MHSILSDYYYLAHDPECLTKFWTDHLNFEEKQALLNLCKKDQKLTFTSKIKHYIRTTDDSRVYVKSYRYPFSLKMEVKKQIDFMLKQEIIRTSYSPWNAPVWVVLKKSDSPTTKRRIVIDYRKLNERTISDKYPIPNINDILDLLGKDSYFSTLDLASGFHQIEMHSEDRDKTAFTVEYGNFEFVRMPFGLKNSPATFQRIMDNVLRELVGTICLVYLDDIIIFSPSLQQH